MTVEQESLRVCWITLRQAHRFVYDHHRHHRKSRGGIFALALMRGDELVGVAIAGRPKSGELQRRGWLEITRVCVIEGVRNGCSMLYARMRRIAPLMGFCKVITYTLPREGGASLRAAGYEQGGETEGGEWDRPSRPRNDVDHPEPKTRWLAEAA